jgi:GTP 3',8-cyclase
MPAEGIELYPKDHILTDDEVIRLARLFVQSGVTKIRLTGGEPTIRKGLLDIVREFFVISVRPIRRSYYYRTFK